MAITNIITSERIKNLITPKNAILCVLTLGLAVMSYLLYRGRKVSQIRQPSAQTNNVQNSALPTIVTHEVTNLPKKLVSSQQLPIHEAAVLLREHYNFFNSSDEGRDPNDSFRYEAYRVNVFVTTENDQPLFRHTIEGMGELLRNSNESIRMADPIASMHGDCVLCDQAHNCTTPLDINGTRYQLLNADMGPRQLVPLDHILHLFQASSELTANILMTSGGIAYGIHEKLRLATQDSYQVEFEINVGKAAGQSIPHLVIEFKNGTNYI
jgi:hypothetical protein